MRRYWPLAAGALALGLVAWALVVTTGTDDPREVTTRRDETESARKSLTSRKPARAEAGAAAPSKSAATARLAPTLPAPGARPAAVDFERTLDELEQFVARIEAMRERKQHMPHAEWVETYRRGNELIDALNRTEEAKHDGPRKTVADLNGRFRMAVLEIQPLPGGG